MTGETLEADILPFRSDSAEGHVIEIYIVTGRHGILSIPESYCRECDMFYRAAKQASEEVEEEVDIRLKSYWTRFLRPLIRGGFHPPVILVDGDLLSQGYDVPEVEDIIQKLKG